MSMSMTPTRVTFGPLLALALAAAAVVAISVPLTARAALSFDHPAQELVHNTMISVFDQLDSDPTLKTESYRLVALLRDRVLPHFNLRLMSRRVLGKHWRRAKTPDRAAFVEQFKNLLLRTYSTVLVSYAGQAVTLLPSRVRPDQKRVMIRTAVDAGGTSPISIDYAMYATNGEWKVYDVTIEGVSLVVTYRSSFGSEIRNNGINALIARMRAKND